MRPARQSVLPANLKSHTETPWGQSESEKFETDGGCSPLLHAKNVPRLGVWLNVEPFLSMHKPTGSIPTHILCGPAHPDLPPLSG